MGDVRQTFSALSLRLQSVGMIPLGAFRPTADDSFPAPSGLPFRTIAIVGNAGPAMWHAFTAARDAGDLSTQAPNPLDRWTRAVLDPIAADLGAEVFYPFGGPPWHPFQRWAKATGSLFQSPIGMLIQPQHGLWIALRAALAFAEDLEVRANTTQTSPCDTCDDRPCVTTCPVGAFLGSTTSAPSYDVTRSRDHLDTVSGGDCRGLGCRARRACPVAPQAAWPSDQTAFHMAAFRS